MPGMKTILVTSLIAIVAIAVAMRIPQTRALIAP